MTLSNTLKAGIVATSLGLTGCANNSEGKNDSFLERVLWKSAAAILKERGNPNEASAIKIIGRLRGKIKAGDYARDIREREAEERIIERVTTPRGYVDLGKYSEVMYKGKPYLVEKINPPNISIFKAFPINDIVVCNFIRYCSGENYSFFSDIEFFRNSIVPISMSMIDDEFFIGRKEDADLMGRLILAHYSEKMYFDPEEGENEGRYSEIPIKDLDMMQE